MCVCAEVVCVEVVCVEVVCVEVVCVEVEVEVEVDVEEMGWGRRGTVQNRDARWWQVAARKGCARLEDTFEHSWLLLRQILPGRGGAVWLHQARVERLKRKQELVFGRVHVCRRRDELLHHLAVLASPHL